MDRELPDKADGNSTQQEAADLVALLRWYTAMGIDIALDAEPHDRFAESAAAAVRHRPAPAEVTMPRPAPALQPTVARNVSETPAFSADAVARSAREQAQAAQTLAALRDALANFEGCGLRATATQLVFADGNPEGDLMIIGEAPGADEDRQGLPFVGRAGQLLDRMLLAIGLDRSKAYIANVVPWRPPGNRAPTPVETAACLPFIERQIELANPKVLVCLGASSAQTLLGAKDGIMRLRGRWFDYTLGDKKIPTLPMLHPAFLLRQPAQKKLAWQDLRELAKKLRNL
jgi:DNA polymerase